MDDFEKHLEQLKKCIVFNTYYWAMWAIAKLEDKDLQEDVYQWEYLLMRIECFEMARLRFNI